VVVEGFWLNRLPCRPETVAVSLDEPITDDHNATRGDLLPDPAAFFEDETIEQTSIQQDCAALIAEINMLPYNQRQALLLTGWRGLALKETAAVLGVPYAERIRQWKEKQREP
jgi:DNA-directed RNA polymerase specialized sigma24 family protein